MRTIEKIFLPFSRNYIFIAIAALVTLYGLFGARTPGQHVYSIGVLVVLIPFLEIRNHIRVMQLFFVFFVCIQVSSIAFFDRLPYRLLIGSQPFWPAVRIGIPVACILCAMAHVFSLRKISLVKLYGLKFPVMIFASIWYVRMLLIMNNCQHNAYESAVRIPAVVLQKCPVCCNIHELWFSFSYEGKQRTVSIDVHPKLYKRTSEGDSLTLQMHHGLYGWPWHHKDIKRRYR